MGFMTNAAKKLMQRMIHMTLKDLLVIGLPIIALVALAFWGAYQFVQPAPPPTLTMVTGFPEGSYQVYATRYKEIFAANNITLEIKSSKGALENLQRLKNPAEHVDVGFVQTGVANGMDTTGLVSLGTVFPEPLWLFYRGKKPIDSLDQLKGKRIAVGAEGSGTRFLATALLEAHGLTDKEATLVPTSGLTAAKALADGELDAVFIVAAAQSGSVWTLLYTPGVSLFNFTQAEAYVRRFSSLTVVTLPRGAIDFPRNIPDRDITLIAPTAMLVAREDTHPALIDLLLQTASKMHGDAGLFQRAGQYPSPNGVDIPLSADAERYYKSGKPFLQRYMPFWAATLINRMIVLLVPVFAILIPLIKIAPYLYSWRVRSRVFRYYGQLKLLELQAQQSPESKPQEAWLAELDSIEQAANRMPTPTAFAESVYTLRAHVHMVRKQLLFRFAQGEVK